MGVISDQAQSPGDLMRRLAELERAVTQLRNARVLENAAIGAGGLRVHSGGSVRIQDGGNLNVSGEADFSRDTSIGGNLDVSANTTIGGDLDVTGSATLASQGAFTVLGTLFVNRDGVPDLPGYLRAYLDESSGRTAMILVPPRQDESSETYVLFEGATPGNPGMTRIQAGGQAQMHAGTDALVTAESGSVSITAENGSAYVTADLVGFRSPNGSGGWAVDVHSIGSRFNAVADNGFTLRTPNDSHRIHVTGNDIGVDAPNRFYVAANVHAAGNLSCGGTKPFIIDHPTKDDKSLVHVATESDKAVIEYHYRATIGDDGAATIDLPDYFEALTAPDSRGVQVTPVGRPFMVGAEEPADGQVIVYGEPGRDVFVRVNARRGDDAGQFEVEIPRIQPPADPDEEQSS